MRFSVVISATILGAAQWCAPLSYPQPFFYTYTNTHRAIAGRNCKCQDPSGNGPQWDGLTQQVCNEQASGASAGASGLACQINIGYHADQHHQVRLAPLASTSEVRE